LHNLDVCCERVYRTQGEQPVVYVHTLDTLSETLQLHDVADVEVAALSLSRDGRRLLSVAREPDLTLIVWDVVTGQQLASAVVEAEVDSAAFNPACDDELLLAGPDGVHVWTLQHHVHQWHCSLSPRRVQLQGWAPLSAAWLPGARLLVGADDGSVLLADARTGQLIQLQPEHPQWAALSAAVCALAVHRHHVLAATVDGTLRLLSLPNPNASSDAAAEPSPTLSVLWEHTLAEEGAPIEVTALCYAPSYNRMALATSDAALYVLTLLPDAAPHAPHVEVQCVAEYHCGAVTALVALPDGQHFAACGDDAVLRVWSAEQRAVAFQRQLSAPLTALAVSANASLLALGSAEGVVRLFALPAHGAQEPVLLWRGRLHDAPVWHLAFSPEGDMLASMGQGGEGALWFVATGTPLPSSTAPHALGCTHQLAAHQVSCMLWASASASAPHGVLLMATHSAEMLWLQPPPLSVQASGPQCELPARVVPMRRLRLEVRPCLLQRVGTHTASVGVPRAHPAST
jgi:WD40 repeat protein